MIFVAVEGTFVCFTAIYRHLFQILYASLVVLLLYKTGTNHETNSDYNQNGKTCAVIGTDTNKTATRETANVDSADTTSKMALFYNYKLLVL